MPRKPTVKSLKKKLDDIFSKYIRRRDHGICFSCGKTKHWKEQQAGHYIKRSRNITRYDERNVHCQCVKCNMFDGGNYPEYTKALIGRYGHDIIDYLVDKSKEDKQFTVEELQELIDIYSKKLKELDQHEQNQIDWN